MKHGRAYAYAVEIAHDDGGSEAHSPPAVRLLRTFRIVVLCSATTLCIATVVRLTVSRFTVIPSVVVLLLTCPLLLYGVAVGYLARRHAARQVRPHMLPPVWLTVGLMTAIGCIWFWYEAVQLGGFMRETLKAVTAPAHWTPG